MSKVESKQAGRSIELSVEPAPVEIAVGTDAFAAGPVLNTKEVSGENTFELASPRPTTAVTINDALPAANMKPSKKRFFGRVLSGLGKAVGAVVGGVARAIQWTFEELTNTVAVLGVATIAASLFAGISLLASVYLLVGATIVGCIAALAVLVPIVVLSSYAQLLFEYIMGASADKPITEQG